MKKITESETYLTTVPKTMDVEKFVTTDGKKFSISDKLKAESHQAQINRIDDFKRLINYKSTEPLICQQPSNEYSHSFTFDWEPSAITKDDKYLLNRLTELVEGNVEELKAGKYLVLEYCEDCNDSGYYYNGYFGLLSDYVTMLETELNKAKSLL